MMGYTLKFEFNVWGIKSPFIQKKNYKPKLK